METIEGLGQAALGQLTDDDMTALSGKKDQLVGKIQERYGITREQAEKEADEWAGAASANAKRMAAEAGHRP